MDEVRGAYNYHQTGILFGLKRETITIILGIIGISHAVTERTLGFQRDQKSKVALTLCPATFLFK